MDKLLHFLVSFLGVYILSFIHMGWAINIVFFGGIIKELLDTNRAIKERINSILKTEAKTYIIESLIDITFNCLGIILAYYVRS